MKGLEKFQPDAYDHIVNHAVGSENLFRSNENYRYFLRKYAHYMISVCSTLCYCLMPNHIHFLVQTHSVEKLNQHPKYKDDIHKLIMQQLSNLLNAYAKAYNKKYERKGALWIDYTKRFEIESNIYLTAAINYIHQNPIKHGFTKKPGDWEHCSFHSHTTGKPTLLSRSEVLDWFGGISEYVKFHNKNGAELIEEWEY
jgi:REP element-mobilizing transposase RayT